jgi:hypothetical protein
MQMSFYKIISLCTLGSILCACAPDYGIMIDVKRNLSTNLRKYHSADVRIENDDYRNKIDRLTNSGGIVVVVFEEIQRLGITPAGKDPKLGIKCLFREGLGKPFRGRHGEILFTSIKWVNIKLIDIPSERVIGEVECTRPRLKHLPSDFMRRMFDALTSSLDETGKK